MGNKNKGGKPMTHSKVAASTPQQSLAEKQLSDYNAVMAGGQVIDPNLTKTIGAWNTGAILGQKEAYDDPDMKKLRDMYEEQAKGYSGQEIGAMRQTARGEMAGAQQAQQRNLASNLAKGGVGGARAAAMQGQQALQGNQGINTAESKMLLDSANMARQGQGNMADFMMRQKMAKLAMAGGISQLSSANTAADKAAQANQGGSGFCCFIFLEARYGNGTMDFVVRKFRDENMTDKNRRGYYKLSEVLVPLMRKSKIVKGLVRLFMTDPLVAYGKAHYGSGSKLGFVFAPVKNFWMKAFNYLGEDHPFVRENGEVV